MLYGFTPEMMEAYSQGTSWGDAAKEAKEKKEQAAADAKKEPQEKLADAFKSCKQEGDKMPRKLLGIVDRETGKLTDQFTILEGHEEEVSRIVMTAFIAGLDIELRERGLLDDEEDNEES